MLFCNHDSSTPPDVIITIINFVWHVHKSGYSYGGIKVLLLLGRGENNTHMVFTILYRNTFNRKNIILFSKHLQILYLNSYYLFFIGLSSL